MEEDSIEIKSGIFPESPFDSIKLKNKIKNSEKEDEIENSEELPSKKLYMIGLMDYLRININKKDIFIHEVIYDNDGPLNILIFKPTCDYFNTNYEYKKILALPLSTNTNPVYSNLVDKARTIYYISKEDRTDDLLNKYILPYTTNVTKTLFDLEDIDYTIMRHTINQNYMESFYFFFKDIPKIKLDFKYDFKDSSMYVFEKSSKAYLKGEEYDDFEDFLMLTGWKKGFSTKVIEHDPNIELL